MQAQILIEIIARPPLCAEDDMERCGRKTTKRAPTGLDPDAVIVLLVELCKSAVPIWDGTLCPCSEGQAQKGGRAMARQEILDRIHKYVEPFHITKGKRFRLKDIDPGET